MSLLSSRSSARGHTRKQAPPCRFKGPVFFFVRWSGPQARGMRGGGSHDARDKPPGRPVACTKNISSPRSRPAAPSPPWPSLLSPPDQTHNSQGLRRSGVRTSPRPTDSTLLVHERVAPVFFPAPLKLPQRHRKQVLRRMACEMHNGTAETLDCCLRPGFCGAPEKRTCAPIKVVWQGLATMPQCPRAIPFTSHIRHILLRCGHQRARCARVRGDSCRGLRGITNSFCTCTPDSRWLR